MNKIYKFKNNSMDLSIIIDSKINIINGDSATGKTFFLNMIYVTITEESLRDGVKTNYDLDKTYVCLGRNDIAGMYSREKNLIFIDRFDTIAIDSKTHEVNQKLIDFINKSNNIFVIMTRGTISGIKCRYSDIYELHSEKVNGIVKIYTE